MDRANQPAPDKRYRDVETVELPTDWSEPGLAMADVQSGTAAPRPPEDRAGLARLLFLAAGVSRHWRVRAFRTYPSAGALYPNEVYVADGEGLSHYEPLAHSFHRLRGADLRAHLGDAAGDPDVAAAPLTLVVTGIPWRTTWKYGARGYRHLFWDAGALVANALTAAPARVVTGFVDAEVARLLGVDAGQPFREFPLLLLPLADSDEPSPAADAVADLRTTAAPLSPEVPDEPELESMHHAGALEDPGAVQRWRAALRDGSEPTTLQPPSGTSGTVEEVILRRGSTRRFDPTKPVPLAALEWGLAAALRAPPADVDLDLLEVHVTVHAVEGLDPGDYRWTAAGLDQLRSGEERRRSARLCLDQPLGGTSGFTAFICADLDAVLEHGGARAYRLAQLAAGIAAARLQLAAFTLGVGATGLTFYDRAIREELGASDPMLVTAVGVPAYRSRPGRRPQRSGVRGSLA